jgi:DNA-binding CsgD family transcriptional regulator
MLQITHSSRKWTTESAAAGRAGVDAAQPRQYAFDAVMQGVAMSSLEADDLVASFYEAACGRTSWHTALHAVASRMDCLLVQIIGVDLQQNRLTFSFEGGNASPEGVIDYARTYHRIDPHVAPVVQRSLGAMVAFSREFDAEFIDTHPFYQDYLIPYGVRHTHAAKLYHDEGAAVFVGFHRAVGKTSLDGADWEMAQRLCFHLVRSVKIYVAMRRTLVEAVIGRDLLDRIAAPLLLVDEQRHVVLQNKAAQEAAASAWPLYVDERGRLACSVADADTEITLAVRALQLSGAAGLQRGSAQDRVVVSVPMAGKPRPLLASFLALRPEATLGAFGNTALAMLVAHDPNRPAHIEPFGLAAAFGLTPAEARVAVALATGRTPKEIAREHGVSFNTVRSQVQAVHTKFGVSRTVELVALIHSLSLGALR